MPANLGNGARISSLGDEHVEEVDRWVDVDVEHSLERRIVEIVVVAFDGTNIWVTNANSNNVSKFIPF